MEDFPIDYKFLMPEAVYAVSHPETGALVSLRSAKPGKFFPLFTDEDLAQTFQKDEFPEYIVRRISSAREFRKIVGQCVSEGCRYVAIDMRHKPKRQVPIMYPIGKFIDELPETPPD
jgi:hypothetical protein